MRSYQELSLGQSPNLLQMRATVQQSLIQRLVQKVEGVGNGGIFGRQVHHLCLHLGRWNDTIVNVCSSTAIRRLLIRGSFIRLVLLQPFLNVVLRLIDSSRLLFQLFLLHSIRFELQINLFLGRDESLLIAPIVLHLFLTFPRLFGAILLHLACHFLSRGSRSTCTTKQEETEINRQAATTATRMRKSMATIWSSFNSFSQFEHKYSNKV
jgi:hypothetical protein